jgi:hypothetical protein
MGKTLWDRSGRLVATAKNHSLYRMAPGAPMVLHRFSIRTGWKPSHP